MKQEINRFSTQQLIVQITKWGTNILFIVAVAILAYMSFVDNFEISPSLRNITTLGLVSLVLNLVIWNSYYQSSYERILSQDIVNKDYSVHRRYYNARKDWKYKDLQDKIRQYNKDFTQAFIQDCEDILGRTEEEIINEGYKGYDHKMIIYKLKHRKYPKTGLRTPKDMLYVLSVGKSNSMRVNTKQSEHYHTRHLLSKVVTSALGAFLGASFVFEFISGNWESALLKVFINIVLLIMSLFFGTTSGIKGGKLKLTTAEEISERLEEWKNIKPTEEPYVKHEEPKVVKEIPKQEPVTIEFK